jgi:hypothetical protein
MVHTSIYDTSNFFILGPLHCLALGSVFWCLNMNAYTSHSHWIVPWRPMWKKDWLDNAVCKHCTYYHILVCTSIYSCTYKNLARSARILPCNTDKICSTLFSLIASSILSCCNMLYFQTTLVWCRLRCTITRHMTLYSITQYKIC